MQIAIGHGRRNGKENEKEERELGMEVCKKKNYPLPFSWPFPLVLLSYITQASTNFQLEGSRHMHEIIQRNECIRHYR
jgi:hypothetical protein